MTSTVEETSLRVLTLTAVRAGIDALQGQRIHEHFPAYLHLRQRGLSSGSLTSIEPVWSEVSELLKMPGGPPTKPHYRPFASRNLKDPSGYWLNRNLPGSYAPKSVRSTSQFMLSSSGDGFSLPPDHAQQAFATLLKGVRAPAWALAAYYLRNFGFTFDGEGGSAELIAGFKQALLFDQGDSDFEILFDDGPPLFTGDWFEPFVPMEQQETSNA